MSSSANATVKSETQISVMINMVLSAVFFLATFGTHIRSLTTGRPDSLALDFLPQSLAIGFFAALVPVLIVNSKRRKGLITGVDIHCDPVTTFLLRATGFSAAAGALGGLFVLILPLAMAQIGYFAALAAKILYGGALALLVTPRAIGLSLRGKTR
jgi:hypothetical protein